MAELTSPSAAASKQQHPSAPAGGGEGLGTISGGSGHSNKQLLARGFTITVSAPPDSEDDDSGHNSGRGACLNADFASSGRDGPEELMPPEGYVADVPLEKTESRLPSLEDMLRDEDIRALFATTEQHRDLQDAITQPTPEQQHDCLVALVKRSFEDREWRQRAARDLALLDTLVLLVRQGVALSAHPFSTMSSFHRGPRRTSYASLSRSFSRSLTKESFSGARSGRVADRDRDREDTGDAAPPSAAQQHLSGGSAALERETPFGGTGSLASPPNLRLKKQVDSPRIILPDGSGGNSEQSASAAPGDVQKGCITPILGSQGPAQIRILSDPQEEGGRSAIGVPAMNERKSSMSRQRVPSLSSASAASGGYGYGQTGSLMSMGGGTSIAEMVKKGAEHLALVSVALQLLRNLFVEEPDCQKYIHKHRLIDLLISHLNTITEVVCRAHSLDSNDLILAETERKYSYKKMASLAASVEWNRWVTEELARLPRALVQLISNFVTGQPQLQEHTCRTLLPLRLTKIAVLLGDAPLMFQLLVNVSSGRPKEALQILFSSEEGMRLLYLLYSSTLAANPAKLTASCSSSRSVYAASSSGTHRHSHLTSTTSVEGRGSTNNSLKATITTPLQSPGPADLKNGAVARSPPVAQPQQQKQQHQQRSASNTTPGKSTAASPSMTASAVLPMPSWHDGFTAEAVDATNEWVLLWAEKHWFVCVGKKTPSVMVRRNSSGSNSYLSSEDDDDEATTTGNRGKDAVAADFGGDEREEEECFLGKMLLSFRRFEPAQLRTAIMRIVGTNSGGACPNSCVGDEDLEAQCPSLREVSARRLCFLDQRVSSMLGHSHYTTDDVMAYLYRLLYPKLAVEMGRVETLSAVAPCTGDGDGDDKHAPAPSRPQQPSDLAAADDDMQSEFSLTEELLPLSSRGAQGGANPGASKKKTDILHQKLKSIKSFKKTRKGDTPSCFTCALLSSPAFLECVREELEGLYAYVRRMVQEHGNKDKLLGPGLGQGQESGRTSQLPDSRGAGVSVAGSGEESFTEVSGVSPQIASGVEQSNNSEEVENGEWHQNNNPETSSVHKSNSAANASSSGGRHGGVLEDLGHRSTLNGLSTATNLGSERFGRLGSDLDAPGSSFAPVIPPSRAFQSAKLLVEILIDMTARTHVFDGVADTQSTRCIDIARKKREMEERAERKERDEASDQGRSETSEKRSAFTPKASAATAFFVPLRELLVFSVSILELGHPFQLAAATPRRRKTEEARLWIDRLRASVSPKALLLLIANLTVDWPLMQMLIAECRGIPVIISHTFLDEKEPFMGEAAIWALRNLTRNQPELQSKVKELTSQAQALGAVEESTRTCSKDRDEKEKGMGNAREKDDEPAGGSRGIGGGRYPADLCDMANLVEKEQKVRATSATLQFDETSKKLLVKKLLHG